MKAILLTDYGGPQKLKFAEIAKPELKPGHVLVKLHAASLNHLDIWVRQGIANKKLAFPHILGSDGAGEIADIWPESNDQTISMQNKISKPLSIGTKVVLNPGISCGYCQKCLSGQDNLCGQYKIIGEHVKGTYAEYISVPRQNVIEIGDISFEEAASIPLAAITAWQMIKKANILPGEKILIMAAGSGVSVYAIQIAKLFGGVVIAAASTDEKLQRAKELGADFAINYTNTDYLSEVKKITDNQGVEIAIDHTGKNNWEKTIRSLAWGGRLITCGATSGYEANTPLSHVFYRQLSIIGSTMGSKADLFSVFDHIKSGKIKPIVDKIIPIEDIHRAHELMESRQFFGKIVLKITQ